MQADAAAIDKNVVTEGHLLAVMLALAGSDTDGDAVLVKSSMHSYEIYQPWKLCDEC
jgi:hypothetical protein